MTEPTMIEMRQAEIDAYTTNIATYTHIVNSIDGNWDADLVQFKTMAPHDAARECPIERVERLSELQQFEQFSFLIKTEMLERAKAVSILRALEANQA
jgi:hypothetical protein